MKMEQREELERGRLGQARACCAMDGERGGKRGKGRVWGC